MLGAEQICQINYFNWLRNNYPFLEENTYHFAGERKCSIQQGRTLKRMGTKPGVFDIFISLPLGGFGGLWLEIKIGKNKPTKEQKEFGKREITNGRAVAIVWGFDDAKAATLAYVRQEFINCSI